ncbi:MAG: Phosphohydrolase (MutT/nudix family protein), partial [uncultured Pseudonocardia sp.]
GDGADGGGTGGALRRAAGQFDREGDRPPHRAAPPLRRGLAVRAARHHRARGVGLLPARRRARLRPRRGRRPHPAAARPARQQPARHPAQHRRRRPRGPAVPRARGGRDAAGQRHRRAVHRRGPVRVVRRARLDAALGDRGADHGGVHAVPQGVRALAPVGPRALPGRRRPADHRSDHRRRHRRSVRRGRVRPRTARAARPHPVL